MKIFFLDVVDAGVSDGIDWLLIAVFGVTILVEATLMFLMKYNSFKRSLRDSFVVNAASIAVGYLLLRIAPGFFGSYSIVNLLKLLTITIAVELGILYLLNRKHPFLQTVKACAVMNMVTYILFWVFITIFER